MALNDSLDALYQDAEIKETIFAIISEAKTLLNSLTTASTTASTNIAQYQATTYYNLSTADVKTEIVAIKALIDGLVAQFDDHLSFINYTGPV